jgi:hypothetical protein
VVAVTARQVVAALVAVALVTHRELQILEVVAVVAETALLVALAVRAL